MGHCFGRWSCRCWVRQLLLAALVSKTAEKAQASQVRGSQEGVRGGHSTPHSHLFLGGTSPTIPVGTSGCASSSFCEDCQSMGSFQCEKGSATHPVFSTSRSSCAACLGSDADAIIFKCVQQIYCSLFLAGTPIGQRSDTWSPASGDRNGFSFCAFMLCVCVSLLCCYCRLVASCSNTP